MQNRAKSPPSGTAPLTLCKSIQLTWLDSSGLLASPGPQAVYLTQLKSNNITKATLQIMCYYYPCCSDGMDGTCAPPFSFVSSKIILFLLRFSSVRNTCTHTYLQSCQPRIYGKCPNGHLISWMFVPISVTSSQSHFWPWLHPLCSW